MAVGFEIEESQVSDLTVAEIDAQLAVVRTQINAFYANGAVVEYNKDDRGAKIDIKALEDREKHLVRLKRRQTCGNVRRAIPLG